MVCRMTPIQGQGQGHEGPKVAKMANFKVYQTISSAGMHVGHNQKTNGKL